MKKNNLKIVFVILLGVLFTSLPKNVNAAQYNYYSYKWVWNYKGAAYYYIVDTTSDWDEPIKQAAQNWFKTGYHTNPLYPMTRTYTQTDSPMDFYQDNLLYPGTLGLTTLYIKGGTYVQDDDGIPTQNWLYSKIYINQSSFHYYYGDNTTLKKVLILHEMGHVFGLAHNDEKSSIMYPYIDEITSTKVTEFDSKGLITKLGGY